MTKPDFLFIGSVPLASAEDVFKTAASTFPHLARVPDGETGHRCNFVTWQGSIFPEFVWKGTSSTREVLLANINATGYEKFAIDSFKEFEKLQGLGIIPHTTRFQVCLATPFCSIQGFVDEKYCEKVYPLYETRLIESIRTIQAHIPPEKLCIQFDMPWEMGAVEIANGVSKDSISDSYGGFTFTAWFDNVETEFTKRLARLISAIDARTELGIHLCYGDYKHGPFFAAKDSSTMVNFMNAIHKEVAAIKEITYFHIPVPMGRSDPEFFTALANLKIGESKLYLGLVHPYDEAGNLQRLELAKQVYDDPIGVSTVCGLGRSTKEELDNIMFMASKLVQ